MTGIEYPTITVGKHENLMVRWTLAAQLLCQRRGIDPMRIGAAISTMVTRDQDGAVTGVSNPDAVQNIIVVFSAMVGENFLDLTNPRGVDLEDAPTADYWATQIENFGEITKVIIASMGKAAEDRRKKLALVPQEQAAAS